MKTNESKDKNNSGIRSKRKTEINPQFVRALHFMGKADSPIFITGKAGTGKSTLLSYFCSQTDKNPVVLAPTGVAALNVGGETIHHFFNFYIDVTPQKIKNGEIKPRKKQLYKNIKVIIIDEVSMLRADLLDCIDVFLQLYGPKLQKPFGGVQMIFIGDLYQLSPVVLSKEKSLFNSYYETPYFFSAHVLSKVKMLVFELEKVYRQKDQKFIELLNRIRDNSVGPEDMNSLNKRYIHDFEPDSNKPYINLTATNKRADQINRQHLHALQQKSHFSEAVIQGKFGEESFPTSSRLEFKVGAQVMLLNNDPKKRWVNGSVGTIEAIKKGDETPYLEVNLHGSNKVVPIFAFTWELYHFSYNGKEIVSEVIGRFTQFPIRLAWAITIHKSQGKTFDRVIIDIGRGVFTSGQVYVALSRCTSFNGIILKTPIKPAHIYTDNRIFDFLKQYQHNNIEEEIEKTEGEVKEVCVEPMIKLIKTAIDAKNKLEIIYLKADGTRFMQIIFPLEVGIRTYQGKKFQGMLAYCTQQKENKLFRVDRILKLKMC